MSGSSLAKCIWLFLNLALCAPPVRSESHLRGKRFLIFPRQAPTRHQFIGGIGIPADLSYESLTIGHVLKAEFFLPYNATTFVKNPYLPEYNTQPNVTADNLRSLLQQPTELRWHIYTYLENRLESYGFKGHECLLKAICDANALRFAPHFSILAELLHLVFRLVADRGKPYISNFTYSPSSTVNTRSNDAFDFLEAERIGKSAHGLRNCQIYTCNMPLLSWISSVLQF